MKKHFLLLFLLTLLPLAGWAQTTVTLYDFTVPYGTELTVANLPDDAWQVSGELSKEEVKQYLTFARVDDGSATWNSNNVGVYSWTLTKAADTDGYTIYLSSNNAKLTIAKATITESVAGVLAAGCTYGSLENPLQLVTTAPTISLAEAQETIEYSLDEVNWSPTKPSVKKVAVHHVYYRVPGTSNWNAKPSAEIGTVEITGTVLELNTDYTAPALVGDALTFQWDAVNGKAVEQTLITAGTTPTNHGKLYYSVDGGEWSEDLPTASAAGDHVVSWKVVGDEGYYDVAPANLAAKNIAAVQPTVTAATGATSLVWTGEAQDLLSAAGSATLGATSSVVYTIKYKAAEAGDWGAESAVIDNSENVEGTAAGIYQINTKVLEDGNYLAAAADPITVQIATKPAFTAAPTAKDLTWNNAAQQLIAAGTGTVAGKVLYQLETNGAVTVAWTDNIENIKATDATKEGNAYVVKYKVEAANYTPVEATAIANVKIKKKVLSVKANNVQKTYAGNANVGGDAAVVGGGAKFTFIGRVESTLNLDDAHVNYDAIDAANKTAGTHEGVLKATTASLEGISTNYDYTIIPGNLIIDKKALTITADQPLSATYHTAYDISNRYSSAADAGVIDGETYDDVFAEGKLPVLTTNAAATNPEPGEYTLAFTEGVLVANPNYTVAYVIPDGAKFVVNPDADSKIVITVLPKTITYGDAEDYTNFKEGTDYYVTGLIGDDVLTTAPTFSRSDASNKNVGTYNLIAENAAVADPSKYPGGFVYNNSTIEIEKKEITVTVNPQTIVKGTNDEALAQLDQDAWSVEGLEYEDTKASLKGALDNMLTPKAGAADAEGTYNDGIVFAFDNANYKLAAAVTGKLTVLAAGTLILDCSKADNAEKIAAQNGNNVNVSIDFAGRTRILGTKERKWTADTWVTMTLPFNISVADLSNALGYAIVNVIDPGRTEINSTSSKFYGKLTMKGGNGDGTEDYLVANKPFMVKTADAITGTVNFGLQTIIAPENAADLSVEAGKGAMFTGTYTATKVGNSNDAKFWFLMGNDDRWAYIPSTVADDIFWNIVPFEGFIDMTNATASAPNMTFYFEELDGSVTAIKSISVDNVDSKQGAKGFYNLNGMKMDGAPVKKGIYIKDGKKVVIK